LTASQDLTVTCAKFPLDEAEDFIDEHYRDFSPTKNTRMLSRMLLEKKARNFSGGISGKFRMLIIRAQFWA